MVGSMQRAAQHEEFTEAVRAQTARHRATAAQSANKVRLKEEAFFGPPMRRSRQIQKERKGD